MSDKVPLPDIRDVDVAGLTVLVRADLNVPMDQGTIADRTRITRFAPTVVGLLERGAKVVVIAHQDRPKGVANPVLSLAPVAQALGEELGRDVGFVMECVGALAEQRTRALPAGAVVVLENLRYHAEEEADDRSFALMLSVHGDIYVNDAPGSSTRKHASIHAIASLMPAYAGPLLIAATAVLDPEDASRLPGLEALISKTKVLENF